MPHISNLRLLFSLLFFPLFSVSLSSQIFSLSPSSSNPGLNLSLLLTFLPLPLHLLLLPENGEIPQYLNRRNASTSKESQAKENKGLSMEESNLVAGFNKRWAEGRDKSDKLKNLQLKRVVFSEGSSKLGKRKTLCLKDVEDEEPEKKLRPD